MMRFKRLLAFAAFLFLGLLTQHPAVAADGDYLINPGDVLQISVWKEDGLDRETLVLPDGSISFPLAGTIAAQGKTPTQLQSEIKTRLATYIPDASVSVSIKAALGHVVSVIGQVNKPGELILGHRTTVMQALAIAGGLTPYASTGSIIILRHQNDEEKSIAFPYDDVVQGRSLTSDIVLQPGDVLVVPTSSLF
ncbi:MAG TPA: polysaccharide biosynthesis/export family protein [Candidatus Sulfotelmatobacter sp.]|jgi:polysaccharide export outer membrane protein|nr:polysaccharide biosynthesis/export family protein [Candidatus Sulfotelmatobacter sp.]